MGTDCSSSGTVNVLLGETKTCTNTNDDDAPSLTIIKIVDNDNGGDATIADFSLTATGVKDENDLSGTSQIISGSTPKADAWVLYEITLPGYAESNLVCERGFSHN